MRQGQEGTGLAPQGWFGFGQEGQGAAWQGKDYEAVEMVSVCELAWLAGLLEGEGSFFLYRSRPRTAKRDYFYPCVVLGMTDKDVVERAARAMGGVTVTRLKPAGASKKWTYRATVRGAVAVALMRDLLPYMGARRSTRIRELLDHDGNRPNANEARRAASRAMAAGRSRDRLGRLT